LNEGEKMRSVKTIHKTDCWCYATKRQVNIEGVIIGKRQADLIEILDCEYEHCPKRYAKDCLIGKIREGRW
jgi:hypothetical protein